MKLARQQAQLPSNFVNFFLLLLLLCAVWSIMYNNTWHNGGKWNILFNLLHALDICWAILIPDMPVKSFCHPPWIMCSFNSPVSHICNYMPCYFISLLCPVSNKAILLLHIKLCLDSIHLFYFNSQVKSIDRNQLSTKLVVFTGCLHVQSRLIMPRSITLD